MHFSRVGETTPKVAVIVATYNQEQFIGRCLRSLLSQTMNHSDFEIIVVNDGSTDRTSFALELFRGAITVINNEENIGLPASLNKAILSTNAPLVVRVDSDDYVNAHFLSVLSLYLNLVPESDAVCCDYFLIDDDENILRKVSSVEEPIACGIMFSKKALTSVGLYDEDFRSHEERELRIRFEKKYKIDHLPLPLYRYRRHSNNMTNNVTEMDYHLKLLKKKHGISNESESK